MNAERAQRLLLAERARVEQLLADLGVEDAALRAAAAGDPSDSGDAAERLTTEGTRELVATSLRERLGALGRAERRVAEGTYGRSVRSGRPIPDDRLEADPAAEVLVDEPAEPAEPAVR